MEMDISAAGGSPVIRLTGRFDYTTRTQFMASMDDFVAHGSGNEVCVEMSGVTYIDSSALGMLLMLRDKARKFEKTVAIANAFGQVRQVLDSAQFERLFRMA